MEAASGDGDVREARDEEVIEPVESGDDEVCWSGDDGSEVFKSAVDRSSVRSDDTDEVFEPAVDLGQDAADGLQFREGGLKAVELQGAPGDDPIGAGVVEKSGDIPARTMTTMTQEIDALDSGEVLGVEFDEQQMNGEVLVEHEAPATTPPSNSGGPSLPPRPAGLGSSSPFLDWQPRPAHHGQANNSSCNQKPPAAVDAANCTDRTHQSLQLIRVKFLRLARRLRQTPHNVVVAQVLYRLGLAEQLQRNTAAPAALALDWANDMAERLEAAGDAPLDFSCTILAIGKTGAGKSSTINSIFGDTAAQTDAFERSTRRVHQRVGQIDGIRVRVIDTPGLSSSSSDRRSNEKLLQSIKHRIRTTLPDVVLYFDRLDVQSRDHSDMPLLASITSVFGASLWFNAIVVLTHAASAPPDGPNGAPLSYEMFVLQRSHVIQQAIRQAAGDVRLMNPVALAENHSACRTNREGQRVLPNGQVWVPQLLLLSFASKILAEANLLLRLDDGPAMPPLRQRVHSLPFLLSGLLQSKTPLKPPDDNDDADEDDESDSDNEPDYYDLPPFKPLTKSELEKLSCAERRAYFDELEYREKLYVRRQLKEEKRRRMLMKEIGETIEDEGDSPASVQLPLPDLTLPCSFDSDTPGHRYRALDSSSRWIVRPVLESQGWDHDVGYEGLNAERLFLVRDRVPLSVSGQLIKDKKEFSLMMEIASSVEHCRGMITSLGFDIQTVGKEKACTLRGESRFDSFQSSNSTSAGLSATVVGDSLCAGLKVEDNLRLGKRATVLASCGAMSGRDEVAYGGRLEVTVKDGEQARCTLAVSAVEWRGDLAVGCNAQSCLPLGRGTGLIGHASISNKGTGQVGVRLNSSEQLQIALVALLPAARHLVRLLLGGSSSQ